MQSSQPQPQSHSSNQAHLSSYYPAFPQQISSQYAACMSQQPPTSIYNLVPHSSNQSQQIANTPQRQTDPTSPTPVSSNKVIVPNIEEELKFLSEGNPKKILEAHRNKKSNNIIEISTSVSNVYPPCNDKKVIQKCGFMDSYLKFLQGDRDESPSPSNLKTGRKINYKSGSPSGTSQPKRKTPCLLITNENNMEPDAHKVQILSDKQILPKKRHIAQATQQVQSTSVIENVDLHSQQDHHQPQPIVHQTQNSSQGPSIAHRPQQFSNINEGAFLYHFFPPYKTW